MDKLAPRNREFSSEEKQMIDAMTDLFGKVPLPEANSAQDEKRFIEAFINAAKAIDLKDYASKSSAFLRTKLRLLRGQEAVKRP